MIQGVSPKASLPTLGSKKCLNPRVVIFSRNRACQLDGLMQSLGQRLRHSWPVSVLWQCGSRDHARGYQILREYWPQTHWKEQVEFKSDLQELLGKTSEETVLFCTDDGVFFGSLPILLEPDWQKVAAVSLRLGRNSRYSHPANEHYSAPPFQGVGKLLAWRWKKAQGDFRVAYSLDAHIYPRKRVSEILQRLDFSNPNQLEDKLNRFGSEDAPEWMLCPEQSCYVSLPINRVNSEFPNRAGLQYPAMEGDLLDKFLCGQRLDVENIVNSTPMGPHQEYPLRWI